MLKESRGEQHPELGEGGSRTEKGVWNDCLSPWTQHPSTGMAPPHPTELSDSPGDSQQEKTAENTQTMGVSGLSTHLNKAQLKESLPALRESSFWGNTSFHARKVQPGKVCYAIHDLTIIKRYQALPQLRPSQLVLLVCRTDTGTSDRLPPPQHPPLSASPHTLSSDLRDTQGLGASRHGKPPRLFANRQAYPGEGNRPRLAALPPCCPAALQGENHSNFNLKSAFHAPLGFGVICI